MWGQKNHLQRSRGYWLKDVNVKPEVKPLGGRREKPLFARNKPTECFHLGAPHSHISAGRQLVKYKGEL